MQTILWDLRYGARMLRKNPGFTLIAVITLSLGIGANTAIFNIVNAVLLRPLAVDKPHQLVSLYTGDFSSGDYGTTSWPDLIDFRERNNTLSGLAAYSPSFVGISFNDTNHRVFCEMVSNNYFSLLGINFIHGRGFLAADDKVEGNSPFIVLSDALWKRSFNSDIGIIGQSVKINGKPFTVSGIAPPTFRGMMRGVATELWVPTTMRNVIDPKNKMLNERGHREANLIGRLKPTSTIEQAREDFSIISQQLYREWPEAWSNIHKQSRKISVVSENESRIFPAARTPVVIFMTLLMTIVGIVLLITCVNIANMLMAKAISRKREIAVRLSIGASRFRLIRQLITESLLLSIMGGVGGILLSNWIIDLLLSFKPPVPIPLWIDLSADWKVFAFTFFITILTGIIFGTAPALASSRLDLISMLKGDASVLGKLSTHNKLRNSLVVLQVAFSVVLFICAGLFLRSLNNVTSIDVGFESDNVLNMSVDLKSHGYDNVRGQSFYDQSMERIRSLPGVISSSYTDELPLGIFSGSRRYMTIEGYKRHEGEDLEIRSAYVSPDFFETMRIPILKGRAFNDGDKVGSQDVVIINESFAKRYWPGVNPLGKYVQVGGGDGVPKREVVGIAKDGKYMTLGESPTPYVYLNAAQSYREAATIIVRTQNKPEDYSQVIQNEIKSIDSSLPILDIKTMNQHMQYSMLPSRIAGNLLGGFGLLALILTISGIYGVTAYSVAQRNHELGVRIALGAKNADILKLVFIQGMKPVFIGVVIGLLAAFGLTRAFVSLLYGLSATDPVIFILITSLSLIIALFACWIPASRALKIDPMIALRDI